MPKRRSTGELIRRSQLSTGSGKRASNSPSAGSGSTRPDKGASMSAGGTGKKETFTFFWKADSPFSQFHPCTFNGAGITYNCAEQYMMHQKAVLFGDDNMTTMILNSTIPKEQKAFGRKVQKFDAKVWGQKCREIVADGNYLKFTQNKMLLASLMATDGTTLVEASPRDKIWGIGMGASNPLAQDRATWKGRNYLGDTLTQVRERIKREREGSSKDE